MRKLIIILALACNGCGERSVSDGTSDIPSVCPIHQVKMHKEKVPVELGIALLTDYDFTKNTCFPFCGDPLEPGRCFPLADDESARVFVCAGCCKEKKIWIEDWASHGFGDTNQQRVVIRRFTKSLDIPSGILHTNLIINRNVDVQEPIHFIDNPEHSDLGGPWIPNMSLINDMPSGQGKASQ